MNDASTIAGRDQENLQRKHGDDPSESESQIESVDDEDEDINCYSSCDEETSTRNSSCANDGLTSASATVSLPYSGLRYTADTAASQAAYNQSTKPKTASKDREGRERLPNSVADLLSRSAQVRRSSVELRKRVDDGHAVVRDERSSLATKSFPSCDSPSNSRARSMVSAACRKRETLPMHNSNDDSLARRSSFDDDNSDGHDFYSTYREREVSNYHGLTSRGLERIDSHGSMNRWRNNSTRKLSVSNATSKMSNTNLVDSIHEIPTNPTNDWADIYSHDNFRNQSSPRKFCGIARGKPIHQVTCPEDVRKTFLAHRNSLSRSKSSHTIGGCSSDQALAPRSYAMSDRLRNAQSNTDSDSRVEDEDEPSIATPIYRSRYAESNYGKNGRYQYKTREVRDRDRSPSASEDTNGSLGASAWSQYLRNKYGSSKTSSVGSSGSASNRAGLSKSKSSHAVCSKTLSESSDEEPTPKVTSRKASITGTERDLDTRALVGQPGSISYGLPRSAYVQKRRMAFKIGTRGTEPGCFTWPRGIAVAPDNNIIVADSSNHRVQVFDSTGRFLLEFGSYGSGEGEFDCLAGVAVNRIGQFIVSDRYNHRVQIFDPSGRFLRAFGSEGRIDGKFSYPWGITTDSLGFIYVCDKENHRIQVFQSDGTFVGKFGSIGSRPGLLEHPHYIAVSNTNRVIVSDSNNHRVQIFDVNGRSLSTFGSEGSDEGQFKFPRGVAVDDQGYIIVGDSGNNRIQIFNPDGTFLKAFGSWGSGEGEFKGLEGVAVSTTGNILVCDRENHRIQIF